FLNGVAIGTGGAIADSLLPGSVWGALNGGGDSGGAAQDKAGYYPPALTGLRGSHVGSFEAAHALRDKGLPANGATIHDTKETYDLVIVGGGISGLAAAYFWHAKNPGARILILDNHDDFGGHAKRNELRANGRMLLANGGTWAIESPFPYSKVARGLMDELGIDPAGLAKKCYRPRTYGLFGVGIDAVPALDCWVLYRPGFKGLGLESGPYPRMGYTPKGFASPKEPYEFHYPDGNATIARMLVRKMIPASAPGRDAEDIVTAKFDYSQLDKSNSQVRIRLSSIVVSAQHAGNAESADHADLTY